MLINWIHYTTDSCTNDYQVYFPKSYISNCTITTGLMSPSWKLGSGAGAISNNGIAQYVVMIKSKSTSGFTITRTMIGTSFFISVGY